MAGKQVQRGRVQFPGFGDSLGDTDWKAGANSVPTAAHDGATILKLMDNANSQRRPFRVIVEGSGFFLEVDDQPAGRYGFHQAHWVHATNEEAAFEIACSNIRSDEKLMGVICSDPSLIELKVEEIVEIQNFDGVEANPSGYAFYPDEPARAPHD